MFPKYKEIVYGLLFGVSATAIDTVMHAQMTDRSFWVESVCPQPVGWESCLRNVFGKKWFRQAP